MPDQNPDVSRDAMQRQRALSRWENEGGAVCGKAAAGETPIGPAPELTNAELVALRVRVIALENMLLALLAKAPEQQLELAREVAGYILPRPGFTQHPLTIRAARHMLDLVSRSSQFRSDE